MLFFPQFESTCGSGPLDPKARRQLMDSTCPDTSFPKQAGLEFLKTLRGSTSCLSTRLKGGAIKKQHFHTRPSDGAL